MSQMSGVASSRAGGGRFSSSGRAALLLAFAVVVGVIALQQIDEVPQALPGSAAQSNSVEPAPAPVAPVAPAPRPPAEVKVLVANGVGVDGAASRVASTLQPAGYQLLTPGNTTQNTPISAVQYVPGYEAEARVVAQSMNLAPQAVLPLATPAPVADLQGANVVLIIGNELANQAQQQPAPGSAAGQPATGATQGQAPAPGAANQGAAANRAIVPNAGQTGNASPNAATPANGPLTPAPNQ